MSNENPFEILSKTFEEGKEIDKKINVSLGSGSGGGQKKIEGEAEREGAEQAAAVPDVLDFSGETTENLEDELIKFAVKYEKADIPEVMPVLPPSATAKIVVPEVEFLGTKEEEMIEKKRNLMNRFFWKFKEQYYNFPWRLSAVEDLQEQILNSEEFNKAANDFFDGKIKENDFYDIFVKLAKEIAEKVLSDRPKDVVRTITVPGEEPIIQKTKEEREEERKAAERISKDVWEGLENFGITGTELTGNIELFENFSGLSRGQQLLALQNLKQIKLGIIEENSEERYEKETTQMTFVSVARKWLRGEYGSRWKVWQSGAEKLGDIKESAKAAGKSGFKKLVMPKITLEEAGKTRGGLSMYGEDLGLIIEEIRQNNIDVSYNEETGKINVNFFSASSASAYFSDFEKLNEKQKAGFNDLIQDLNDAAGELSQIPYEWGIENIETEAGETLLQPDFKIKSAKRGNLKKYEKAREHYEKIKIKFLKKFKDSGFEEEETVKFLTDGEYLMEMNRFLNNNSDVEKALGKIENPGVLDAAFSPLKFTARGLTGAASERALMTGFGFFSRRLAGAALGYIGAPLAAAGFSPTFLATLATAAGISAATARHRGQEMLILKKKKARRGKQSKEEKQEQFDALLNGRIEGLEEKLRGEMSKKKFEEDYERQLFNLEELEEEKEDLLKSLHELRKNNLTGFDKTKLALLAETQEKLKYLEDYRKLRDYRAQRDKGMFFSDLDEAIENCKEKIDKKDFLSDADALQTKNDLEMLYAAKEKQEKEGKQIIFEKASVLNEVLDASINDVGMDYKLDENGQEVWSTHKEIEQNKQSLRRAYEYVSGVLENGFIDFGEKEVRTKNQYDLMRNMFFVKTYMAALDEETEEKINGRLNEILSERQEAVGGLEKKFLKKRMLYGAVISAAFAGTGYGVRHYFWDKSAGTKGRASGKGVLEETPSRSPREEPRLGEPTKERSGAGTGTEERGGRIPHTEERGRVVPQTEERGGEREKLQGVEKFLNQKEKELNEIENFLKEKEKGLFKKEGRTSFKIPLIQSEKAYADFQSSFNQLKPNVQKEIIEILKTLPRDKKQEIWEKGFGGAKGGDGLFKYALYALDERKTEKALHEYNALYSFLLKRAKTDLESKEIINMLNIENNQNTALNLLKGVNTFHGKIGKDGLQEYINDYLKRVETQKASSVVPPPAVSEHASTPEATSKAASPPKTAPEAVHKALAVPEPVSKAKSPEIYEHKTTIKEGGNLFNSLQNLQLEKKEFNDIYNKYEIKINGKQTGKTAENFGWISKNTKVVIDGKNRTINLITEKGGVVKTNEEYLANLEKRGKKAPEWLNKIKKPEIETKKPESSQPLILDDKFEKAPPPPLHESVVSPEDAPQEPKTPVLELETKSPPVSSEEIKWQEKLNTLEPYLRKKEGGYIGERRDFIDTNPNISAENIKKTFKVEDIINKNLNTNFTSQEIYDNFFNDTKSDIKIESFMDGKGVSFIFNDRARVSLDANGYAMFLNGAKGYIKSPLSDNYFTEKVSLNELSFSTITELKNNIPTRLEAENEIMSALRKLSAVRFGFDVSQNDLGGMLHNKSINDVWTEKWARSFFLDERGPMQITKAIINWFRESDITIQNDEEGKSVGEILSKYALELKDSVGKTGLTQKKVK